MKDFKTYRDDVALSLKDAGIGTDDIPSLLTCRTIINGTLEYLRDLASNYYEASKVEEATYKQNKAAVILSSTKSATAAKIDAEAQELTLKADFINMEGRYKTIRAYVDTLTDLDNVTSQRISYLKQEQNLNNFVK